MNNKVKISSKCQVCNGKGIISSDETITIGGQTRIFHITCDACNGRGKETRWIKESEPARMKATVEISA